GTRASPSLTGCPSAASSPRSQPRASANPTCTMSRSSRRHRITAQSSHPQILILDFGAQYTQLIARRVREAKVYCEIHPHDVSDAFVRDFGAKGIILSGSHLSAYEEQTAKAPQAVFQQGVPVLGICYGMQTMAEQ